MANGICVYAESYNGELETVAAELVSAAKGLAETTKEKVQAIVLSDHAEELVKELDKLGVDEIYAVKADHDITLQTVLSILNRTNRPTEKMYLLQFLQKKVFIRR